MTFLVIVGDAFARPLVEAFDRLDPAPDVAPLTVVLSGGAVLSPSVKERVGRAVPGNVVDRRLRRVGDRRPGPERVGRRRADRVGAPLPRERRDDRARRRLRRSRPGWSAGSPGAGTCPGVLPRPGEDGGDVPGDRRRALVGARRPRPHRGRRHHHRARPRVGVDQHRRREGLPGGGRVGTQVERRGLRRRRRRCARRALGRAGHRGRAAAAGRRSHARLPRRAHPRPSWRRTRCRGAWCWSTRSCGRRRASPTTGGHGPPPSPPRSRRSLQV